MVLMLMNRLIKEEVFHRLLFKLDDLIALLESTAYA